MYEISCRFIQRPYIIFIMSGKISKWKEVKSTGDRLNKILNTKATEIPCKFAPKRDRSESVDKLFNSSRSRLHSSMEHTALNKTRQQQFADQRKFNLLNEKKEQLDKRASNMLPSLTLGQRKSTYIIQGSQYLSARPSQLISQIKKQYQTFKKNILAELERQRQMIQKMLKQLILTFEYEIEKLAHHQNKSLDYIQTQKIKEDNKIKSIEDWKTKLESVSLTTTANSVKRVELKQSGNLNRNILRPSKQKHQDLQPPKLPVNIDSFLGCIANIKRQMDEIDKVFDKSQQPINQKRIKK